MNSVQRIDHEFVEFIPNDLAPNTIYVSMEYGTAVHACLCGCGHRVITPFTPNDWKLTYDGDTISLHPSIGNWSFPCQSHYIIKEGRVIWVEQWSQERIDTGHSWDKRRKQQHFAHGDQHAGDAVTPQAGSTADAPAGEKHSGWSARNVARAIASRLRRRR